MHDTLILRFIVTLERYADSLRVLSIQALREALLTNNEDLKKFSRTVMDENAKITGILELARMRLEDK